MRAAAVAVVLVAGSARAQEVPPQLALMVMLKVLTYDTHFGDRGGGDFVVLVPFTVGDESRASDLVDKAKALELKSINERPLKFMVVPAENLGGGTRASAVLLHAGFPEGAARDVIAAANKARLYSLALEESLVKRGAMLSVASNAGKPQVVLNVTTARAIGAEMGPSVLKVARTVH